MCEACVKLHLTLNSYFNLCPFRNVSEHKSNLVPDNTATNYVILLGRPRVTPNLHQMRGPQVRHSSGDPQPCGENTQEF